jgi:hypothetical protein
MPEPVSMKLGVYIMATESISMAYFINLCHQSVCLHVYPSIVARQQLGKSVPRAINIHATMEQLLNASFSIRSLSYQSRDSAVGTATGYGLNDRGVGVRVSVRTKIFFSPRRPDRLWGPPNLLSNGYRG